MPRHRLAATGNHCASFHLPFCVSLRQHCAQLGFKTIHCDELESEGVDHVAKRIMDRVGDNPLYLSIDIDVLDPAHAPGTGTPEIAGLSSRELVNIIRGLQGANLVAADIVEVAPAYDHAEITSLAAATVAYEMVNLIVCRPD